MEEAGPVPPPERCTTLPFFFNKRRVVQSQQMTELSLVNEVSNSNISNYR